MESLHLKYGLNSNVKLEQFAENHIVLIRKIKSRIIQKEANKIVEQAKNIWAKDSSMKVSLICNPNICSKSISLLKEHGIDVVVD